VAQALLFTLEPKGPGAVTYRKPTTTPPRNNRSPSPHPAFQWHRHSCLCTVTYSKPTNSSLHVTIAPLHSLPRLSSGTGTPACAPSLTANPLTTPPRNNRSPPTPIHAFQWHRHSCLCAVTYRNPQQLLHVTIAPFTPSTLSQCTGTPSCAPLLTANPQQTPPRNNRSPSPHPRFPTETAPCKTSHFWHRLIRRCHNPAPKQSQSHHRRERRNLRANLAPPARRRQPRQPRLSCNNGSRSPPHLNRTRHRRLRAKKLPALLTGHARQKKSNTSKIKTSARQSLQEAPS